MTLTGKPVTKYIEKEWYTFVRVFLVYFYLLFKPSIDQTKGMIPIYFIENFGLKVFVAL